MKDIYICRGRVEGEGVRLGFVLVRGFFGCIVGEDGFFIVIYGFTVVVESLELGLVLFSCTILYIVVENISFGVIFFKFKF